MEGWFEQAKSRFEGAAWGSGSKKDRKLGG
jgi:hypothetical protein